MNLSDVVDALPRRALVPGATLLPEEAEGTALIFVDEGVVVLRSIVAGSTRRTITCHAGAGALILTPDEHEVLAALTDAVIVPISEDTRARLLEHPRVASLLVDGLAATLRQKHAAIAGMSRLHHVDRVREKLIELAREHGRVGPGAVRLDFPLTHDLLGEMTGSARETVTRALDELQREGFVERRGRTYSLHVRPLTLRH